MKKVAPMQIVMLSGLTSSKDLQVSTEVRIL